MEKRIFVIGMFLAAATAAVVLGGAACRQVLQHRAEFRGGLTFIGGADGLFGSRYRRVALWRAPGYTDPLPALTVYIEDQPYALDAFTSDRFVALGGTRDHGNLIDSRGCVLGYRFEGGKLTWFSLDAERPIATRGPGGNVKRGRFALSNGAGAPCTLPASGQAVRAALGPPARTHLVFAQ